MHVAARVVLTQTLVTLLAGVAFATYSLAHGASALTGGGICILATALQARSLFAGGSPEAMQRELVRGEVRKWLWVVGAFALALGLWRESRALPLVATFALAQAAFVVLGISERSRYRGRRRRID